MDYKHSHTLCIKYRLPIKSETWQQTYFILDFNKIYGPYYISNSKYSLSGQ